MDTAGHDVFKPDVFKRDVGAELDVEITDPTTLEFQIAVAPQPGADVSGIAVVRVQRQGDSARRDSGDRR